LNPGKVQKILLTILEEQFFKAAFNIFLAADCRIGPDPVSSFADGFRNKN
jgi:hypothetical protein